MVGSLSASEGGWTGQATPAPDRADRCGEDLHGAQAGGVLVGRFATIAAVHELSVRDLRNIVNGQIEDSPIEQQRLLARLHGIELELTEEALDVIAEQAAALVCQRSSASTLAMSSGVSTPMPSYSTRITAMGMPFSSARSCSSFSAASSKETGSWTSRSRVSRW